MGLFQNVHPKPSCGSFFIFTAHLGGFQSWHTHQDTSEEPWKGKDTKTSLALQGWMDSKFILPTENQVMIIWQEWNHFVLIFLSFLLSFVSFVSFVRFRPSSPIFSEVGQPKKKTPESYQRYVRLSSLTWHKTIPSQAQQTAQIHIAQGCRYSFFHWMQQITFLATQWPSRDDPLMMNAVNDYLPPKMVCFCQ